MKRRVSEGLQRLQRGCIYDIHRNSGWRSRPAGGSPPPLFVGTRLFNVSPTVLPILPTPLPPSGSQENTSGRNNRSRFCIFWGKTKLEESPYGCRSVQEIFAGNTQPGSHHHCALILGAWQCETAGVPDPAKRPARIHDLVVGAGRNRTRRWGLLAVGLFTRPVAFVLSGNMAVAYFMVHAPKNFFPLLNGGDSAILYCFIFLLFFVAGPGRWSVDERLMDSSRTGYGGVDHHRQRTAGARR